MKNVVICVSVTDHALKLVKSLKNSAIIRDSKVHLVHCFETQVYTGEYFVGTFPAPDQYTEIEKSILQILDSVSDHLGKDVVVSKKCIFSADSKESVKDYLEEVNADLAVIATRGKHGISGLFSSSFAEYMVRHSPCDIHILRPEK